METAWHLSADKSGHVQVAISLFTQLTLSEANHAAVCNAQLNRVSPWH